MIDATEWLVCAFASQERAKVRTSGNPVLSRRVDPRLRGGDKQGHGFCVSASFPPNSVIPPRALWFKARGAFGGCGNPVFVLACRPCLSLPTEY